MAKNLVQKIRLSADETERLQNRLDEMISQAEEFRTSSNWSDLHEQYWLQHLAQPESDTKDFPWKNSSNLFLPLTQSIDLAIVAQEFDSMFSADPKVIGVESSDYTNAEDLTDYYFGYFFREVVNLQKFASDYLLDNVVDGTSVAKVRYNRDWFVRRVETVEPVPTVRKEQFPDPITGEMVDVDVPDTDFRIAETATLERVEQAEVDVADLENIYVAPDTGPDLQWPVCRWYYQQSYLTWEDLVERRRNGYQNIDDDLKAHLSVRGLSDVEKVKARQEGTAEEGIERVLQVLEFYMRWPLPARYLKVNAPGDIEDEDQAEGDEEGFAEEVVVTYAPEAQKILLIRPLSRVTPDGKRPHVINHYHRLPRYVYGQGVPSKLRHLQAALNSQTNQSIDYGTLAVLPWGFYSPGVTGILPDMGGLYPGAMVECLDPRGIVFPRLQGDPNFWLQANQTIQMWAEKVSNVNDYSMGRAPNLPNAPRTRGGQAMMLQQSNIGFSLLVNLHAQAFIEVFRRVHSFHRKYASPDKVYRVLNKKSGAFQQKSVKAGMFDTDVDFSFVLNPNRALEQQVKQVLFTITMQAFMQALQAPVIAMNIRTALGDLYLAHGMKNFDAIWPAETLQLMQPPPTQPVAGPPGAGATAGGPQNPEMMPTPQEMEESASPVQDQYGYEHVPETSNEEANVGIA